jgi:putative ABC transport system ATP-binding protein
MKECSEVVLQVEAVRRTFRQGDTEVVALDDVCLTVDEGAFVVVLGPSGSGKTTLLHVIAGLLPPTSGRVTVAGHDLTRMRDRERARFRRSHLGIVFQSFNLVPTLTAEENVALPLLLDGKPPAAAEPRVAESLDRVGLLQRRHHLPDDLSGGECQRVALARALVAAPSLVLADEPTGNLDERNGRMVLDLLGDARQSLGRTVILATHDPRARSYATEVVQLVDGRLRREHATPSMQRPAPARPVHEAFEAWGSRHSNDERSQS